MAFDAHKNFAYGVIATVPVTPTSGTSLVLQSGHGAAFPAPPFNATVWPTAPAQPTNANAEIVRVTAKTGDTLTIARAQEGTSVRAMVIGDQIAAGVTAKTMTDVEASFAAIPAGANTSVQYNAGGVLGGFGSVSPAVHFTPAGDGSTNLGVPADRWKDGNFSGTVTAGAFAPDSALGWTTGTFLPTLAGAGVAGTHTYGARSGTYIKFKKLLFLTITCDLSAKGGTMAGQALITGLPFPVSGASGQVGLFPVYVAGITFPAGATQFGFVISSGSTTVALYGLGTTSSPIDATNIASALTLRMNGFYQID